MPFFVVKCKMQNAECRMQSAKCKVQNAKCKVQNAKCRMQSAECKVPTKSVGICGGIVLCVITSVLVKTVRIRATARDRPYR